MISLSYDLILALGAIIFLAGICAGVFLCKHFGEKKKPEEPYYAERSVDPVKDWRNAQKKDEDK